MSLRRIAALAALLAACAILYRTRAQQAGGVDEIAQRSIQDRLYQGSWESQPGGVPEENHWETLVLMGVGDTTAAVWDGRAEIANGEIFNLDGYRFELPDRILPQGGWTAKTKREQILYSSPVEGPKSTPEYGVLPKGVLLRGKGTEATRVTVATLFASRLALVERLRTVPVGTESGLSC